MIAHALASWVNEAWHHAQLLSVFAQALGLDWLCWIKAGRKDFLTLRK